MTDEIFPVLLNDQKALLIAVCRSNDQKSEVQEHIQELALLAETYGIEAAESVICPLRKYDSATFIGKGKVEELAQRAKEIGATLILFDDEISPSQQRNLEKIFEMTVMDRTELIIEVFSQRARSKEARLQVELAKVKYQLPRLKRLWTHLSRQAGGGSGGVFVKGEGEKQIELDRRLLDRQIEKLEKQIKEVAAHRKTQRQLRDKTEIPVFAIVGYTNAGKSTLLNALTEAGVLVEDKLFATLDPTTRRFTLPSHQEILLVDTVGFIRKLPHLLVNAFRSTLEEALEADVLLNLVDVSHPAADRHYMATRQVLADLKLNPKSEITLLNKIDQVEGVDALNKIRCLAPNCVPISAKTHEGFAELLEAMQQELRKSRLLLSLSIPQQDYHLVAELLREGCVLKQDFEGNDILLEVEVPPALQPKLQRFVTPSP
ncbi:MAG: hflX [Chlamydiales bacterium]|nr:hflX [Chlamydiales bacterium]